MHFTPIVAVALLSISTTVHGVPIVNQRDTLGLFTSGSNAAVGSEPPCPPDQQGPSIVANTEPKKDDSALGFKPVQVTSDNSGNTDIDSPDCHGCNGSGKPLNNDALLNIHLDNGGNLKIGDNKVGGGGLPGLGGGDDSSPFKLGGQMNNARPPPTDGGDDNGGQDGGLPGVGGGDGDKGKNGNGEINIHTPGGSPQASITPIDGLTINLNPNDKNGKGGDNDPLANFGGLKDNAGRPDGEGKGGDKDGNNDINIHTPGGSPQASITPIEGTTINLNPNDDKGKGTPTDDAGNLGGFKNNAGRPQDPPANNGGGGGETPVVAAPPAPAQPSPEPTPAAAPAQQEPAPEPKKEDAPPPTPTDNGNANTNGQDQNQPEPAPSPSPSPEPAAAPSPSPEPAPSPSPSPEAAPAPSPSPESNPPPPASNQNQAPPPASNQDSSPPPPASNQNTAAPPPSNQDNGSPPASNQPSSSPADSNPPPPSGDSGLPRGNKNIAGLPLPLGATCPASGCPKSVIPCPTSLLDPLNIHYELAAQPLARACLDLGAPFVMPDGMYVCPQQADNFINIHLETSKDTFLGKIVRLCFDGGLLPINLLG